MSFFIPRILPRLGLGTLLVVLATIGAAASTMPICQPVSAAGAKQWLDPQISPSCRAEYVLQTLVTLDDKLAFLSGAKNAELGLAPMRRSDGPHGPTRTPGAYAMPNELVVAASFDPKLAYAYGVAIGQEFHAAGLGQMLGPTVDLERTWHAGRVPETYGEDPFLASAIAAPEVRGIQDQHVGVTLKHFVVYTQEQGRTGDLPFGQNPAVNVLVSERVMREVYFKSFEAAVTEGGAVGVMCAFPRIDGVYACENAQTLGILKNEWGLIGTVSPDFPDAQRTVIAAANAGLDAGNWGFPRAMPGPPMPAAAGPNAPPAPPVNPIAAALMPSGAPGGIDLKTAVLTGKIPQSRVDDMIRRQLMARFTIESIPAASVSPPASSRETALAVATQGAVLLKNDGGILPFGAKVKRIALIGAQASDHPIVVEQGSAYVEPAHLETVLEAVRARAGANISVAYAPGSLPFGDLPSVPDFMLRTPDGAPGVRAEYVANPNLDFGADKILSRVEPNVEVAGPAPAPNLPANQIWSIRWSGTLTPSKDGWHYFTLGGPGTGRLYIEDHLVAEFAHVDFGAVASGRVELKAGHPVSLRVEWTPREGAPFPAQPRQGTSMGVRLHLGLAEPDRRIAEAVAVAKNADVAVVFVSDPSGEGADRLHLSLPAGQDEMIAAVAAANPRTVVVLNTGGPVSMPWLANVRAVMEMWYPGDVEGAAAAQLLFGDAEPRGRLPMTFPANEHQGLGTGTVDYPGVPGSSGALETVRLGEGLNVGYRYYDAHNQTPLFPFGFGLGYTHFSLRNLSVSKFAKDGTHVRVAVRNDGARPGAEIVQAYLTFPKKAHEPLRQLVGFQKVSLKPGEVQIVDIALPLRAFQIWDEVRHAWTAVDGAYTVSVGRSARERAFLVRPIVLHSTTKICIQRQKCRGKSWKKMKH